MTQFLDDQTGRSRPGAALVWNFMKFRVIVSINVTGGGGISATLTGICLAELIAAGSRSHNQIRLNNGL